MFTPDWLAAVSQLLLFLAWPCLALLCWLSRPRRPSPTVALADTLPLPRVSPSSSLPSLPIVSHVTALDRYLGPGWAIYCCTPIALGSLDTS